jgi:predicted nucleic acid-binding protein
VIYLVDTNIWLERLLAQTRTAEVGEFLNRVPSDELSITDFAFHSICVIMCRLQREQALLDFTEDVLIDGGVRVIALSPEYTPNIVTAMNDFHLDFDDAYQFVAAEDHDLVIVSFDADLDRTPRGRATPAEVVAGL